MTFYRRFLPLLAALIGGGLLSACGQAELATDSKSPETHMTVYKSPTCGCCQKWVEHIRSNGITVTVVDEPQMNPLKGSLGIPSDLRSCHTAKIGGYLIEGHVPAADILRLSREQPAVQGLAVAGMPIGSPGMEIGDRVDAYTVVAFGEEQRYDFAHHGGDRMNPATFATPPERTGDNP